MVKVSVIIPVYNVEPYLRECLDSVINQTLKDVEIICINDGSTDNSLAILQEYAAKDSRIIVIDRENRGAAKSRNEGIERATGEFICFIDSDDYIAIDYLEKLYCEITTTDADICFCYHNNFTVQNDSVIIKKASNNEHLIPTKRILNSDNCPDTIFQICSIAAFTKLYRLNFLKRYSIKFQSLKTCNDVYFNCATLASADKISVVREYLVYYRTNRKNSITSERGKYLYCIMYAMQEVKKYLKTIRKFKKLKNSYYKCYLSSIMYELRCRGDFWLRLRFRISLIKSLNFKYWLLMIVKGV